MLLENVCVKVAYDCERTAYNLNSESCSANKLVSKGW